MLAKLAAGREKDYEFAAALVAANLVDPAILANRLHTLPADPRVTQHIQTWLSIIRSTVTSRAGTKRIRMPRRRCHEAIIVHHARHLSTFLDRCLLV